jgi:uncharacterized membrane protein
MANSTLTESVRPPQSSGAAERAITVASGALLLAPLLRKRSVISWAAATAGSALIYDGLSGSCVVSHKLGVSPGAPRTQRLKQSITIGKEASELYALWRRPDTFTKLMRPFADIEPAGENHLRWCIPLPMGQKLHGEAVMVEDLPGKMVHWSTLPDASLRIDEWFRLKPAPKNLGTEISLEYMADFSHVPGGGTLRAITTFFNKAPRAAVSKMLHNFKALAETGEVPTLERNPSGRRQTEMQGNGHWRGDLI